MITRAQRKAIREARPYSEDDVGNIMAAKKTRKT